MTRKRAKSNCFFLSTSEKVYRAAPTIVCRFASITDFKLLICPTKTALTLSAVNRSVVFLSWFCFFLCLSSIMWYYENRRVIGILFVAIFRMRSLPLHVCRVRWRQQQCKTSETYDIIHGLYLVFGQYTHSQTVTNKQLSMNRQIRVNSKSFTHIFRFTFIFEQ